MTIRCHPHALARMEERGTSEEEVIETVENGKRFAAKVFGTTSHLVKNGAAAVQHQAGGSLRGSRRHDWIVVTVLTRYF